MSIEHQPEYQAAVIQMRADGLENLDEDHRVVAERARCKELYELSGWEPNDSLWYLTYYYGDYDYDVKLERLTGPDGLKKAGAYDCPAYDLGYLLRKLPRHLKDDEFTYWLEVCPMDNHESWGVSYSCQDIDKHFQFADTPEDAAAKLAIELFKQGILTKETS